VRETLLKRTLMSLHVTLGLAHQFHFTPHRPRLLARTLKDFFVQTEALENLLLSSTASIFTTYSRSEGSKFI
jgi:hypothetical protein